MPSLWRDSDVAGAIQKWAPRYGEDLIELVYASRLLGIDRTLVSFGGGNSSLKRDEKDPTGSPWRVLRVKGSGRDMQDLLPEDFCPLALSRLMPLATLGALDDDTLINTLETAKLAREAPAPSVEALLHAFLPAPFVLHTHAEPLLLLGNQPDGKKRLEDALGEMFRVIEYASPGFSLAKAAQDAMREAGTARLVGIAVRQHGLFTWGERAREAYETMIAGADVCIAASSAAVFGQMGIPEPEAPPAQTAALSEAEGTAPKAPTIPLPVSPRTAPANEVAELTRRAAAFAPKLRGALAIASPEPGGPPRRFVLTLRTSAELRFLLEQEGTVDAMARGVPTPDQALLARSRPLLLPSEALEDDGALGAAIEAFGKEYEAYVERHAGERVLTLPDDRPRVILVPGLGVFGAGTTLREAAAAAEIGERWLIVATQAELLGHYDPPSEGHVFGLEFWPPQQAKLLRRGRKPLEGRVALVTGAAGAIGAGVAEGLAEAGALVALADRPDDGGGSTRLETAAERIRELVPDAALLTLPFDVSDPDDVEAAFQAIAVQSGGVDLLVLSHGMAEVGEIDQLDPKRLDTVFGVNTLGSFHTLGSFVRGIKAQGAGGDVVLISTKNVPDPGASFSAYSASKAAAHQLGRVAALELAPHDVRVNMVSPDAVFGDAKIPSQLWSDVGAKRARSKGLDPATLPEHYRQRNLLKARVTARHVAEAVLFFAERRSPTTGAVLPVDGGLPGAFPR